MSSKKRPVAAGSNGSGGAHAASAAAASTWKKRQSMQVSVVVRVRPLLARDRQHEPAVRVIAGEKRSLPSTLTLIAPDDNAEPVHFQLDKCYDERTPHRVLFEKEVAPAVAGVFAGINTTVFAYGATGTGKTFTMEGNKKNLGVIPRCIKLLFEVAEESKCEFQVELSYLEIYNDKVQDLLSPPAQQPHQADLPIRQQPNGTIAVQGLTTKLIATLVELEQLYEKGSAARKKAATELNPESSRSHSILMAHMRSVDHASGETRTGKLHLIDLAGSEDNRCTGNSGARLAESGKINTSLFVLGKVIMALNAGDNRRIPFRDSKLTRLLQDSLGGSSHAVMICNVAPTMGMYADTLQTLNYALKTKGIVNKVTINRTPPPPPVPAAKSGRTDVKNPEEKRSSLSCKPVSSASSSSSHSDRPTGQKPKTAHEMRKEKLLQWKLAKANTRIAVLEQREAHSSRGSVGGGSGSGTSSGKRKSQTVGGSLGHPASTGLSSSSEALATVLTSSTSTKKPRLSTALSPVSTTANCATQSRSIGKITPDAKSSRTPADGKENTPLSTSADIYDDGDPVGLAKKLIGVAIDLERKKRPASAYCVFNRAAHVLPHANAELAQWLRQLAAQCPVAEALVPTQSVPTAVYMETVLERDLLDVLNSGSKAELMEMSAIGAKCADKILERRPFHQLGDLLRVPSISPKLLAAMRAQHISWR